MRNNIIHFVEFARAGLWMGGPIYEFGSLQVPGQTCVADFRTLFPDDEYVGCDMREGPGVDKVLNLHDIDLPSNSVGTVLCLDTLEHVEYPRKALKEIYRVLKPEGIVVISSVMDFPIHDHPNDYWRFTPEAFMSILSPYSHSFVGFQGRETFPHTVIGIGFKGHNHDLTKFTEQYSSWQKKDIFSTRQLVLKFTPPVFLPFVAALYRSIRKYTLR